MNVDYMIERDLDQLSEFSLCQCSVCHDWFPENDPRWRLAHRAACKLSRKSAYVCSFECSQEWSEIWWDHILEWEADHAK